MNDFAPRYDLLVALMTSQLGDIADRKSPAYYIVMRAQEREVFSRRIFPRSRCTRPPAAHCWNRSSSVLATRKN
jgi:hypothetical protein